MISRTLSNYPLGIDVFKLLRELELCKGSLIKNRERMAVAGGDRKPKLINMARCAFIVHVFAVEHVPASRTDLIGIVNLMMLK